jgi:hypothetical protein
LIPHQIIHNFKKKLQRRFTMKSKSLFLVLMTIVLVAFMSGQAMSATPSHLNVSANNIVQVVAKNASAQQFDKWVIQKADGSESDFVVPDGQVLVVTDFYQYQSSDAVNIQVYLTISPTDGSSPSRTVYFIGSTSSAAPFQQTFSDHMTTGFVVPAGWQLDEPHHANFTLAPPVVLQGYFTTVK